VRGTTHDPERPKNSEERHVVIDYDVHGFGRGYVARLQRYIDGTRQTTHYPEIFLSSRAEKDTGAHPPLTTVGVQKLLKRLENATGIHCNPHKLRHTYATRCVDKGVPMFHLQDALGHRSLDMVRRYYTRNRHTQAEGFYRAFGANNR
jgi:integrase/recombinase XerD